MKFSKRTKKKVSACLSMILAVNTCSVISFIASGSDSAEASTASSPAVSKAATYLGTKVNPDKSIGDNRIINDTSYALSALRASGAKGYEDSFGWLSDKADSQNTDITARLASSSGNSEYLGQMETKQNKDGGFGLYPDYSSDVLDSLLVLNAINETGYSGTDISGASVCSYLINAKNKDGGFAYAESNKSDPLLTAIAVYDIGRFCEKNRLDMSQFSTSISYISDNIEDSYEDGDIQKTICKYLALSTSGQNPQLDDVIKKLEAAQKSDGSFAGDITTTYWAIKLLEAGEKSGIEDPVTSTSTATTQTGTTTTSSAVTTSVTTTTSIPPTPVSELKLNSSIKDGTVELRWNDISDNNNTFRYKLYRRGNGGEWESNNVNSTIAADATFKDANAPKTPQFLDAVIDSGKIILSVQSKDTATVYEYYVSAESEENVIVVSNTTKHEALSGIAGFVAKVTDSDKSSPALIEYESDKKTIKDLIKADKDGKADITVVPNDPFSPQYIHIFAADNAGNISSEIIAPIPESTITAKITADKTTYSAGDTVSLSVVSESAPFDSKADAKVTVIDEKGNKVSEHNFDKDTVITADKGHKDTVEIKLPDNVSGKMKAVITWSRNGEEAASAETEFTVSASGKTTTTSSATTTKTTSTTSTTSKTTSTATKTTSKTTTSTAKTTSSAPVTTTTTTTTQPVQEKTKLGDVNFDNKVDSVDASLILAEYAKISTNQNTTFNEKQFTAGDVDETNVIDSVDASKVLAYYSYTSTGGKLSDMRDWLELTAEAPKKED